MILSPVSSVMRGRMILSGNRISPMSPVEILMALGRNFANCLEENPEWTGSGWVTPEEETNPGGLGATRVCPRDLVEAEEGVDAGVEEEEAGEKVEEKAGEGEEDNMAPEPGVEERSGTASAGEIEPEEMDPERTGRPLAAAAEALRREEAMWALRTNMLSVLRSATSVVMKRPRTLMTSFRREGLMDSAKRRSVTWRATSMQRMVDWS